MKSLVIENSTQSGTVVVTSGEDIFGRREFSKSGELAAAIQQIFLEIGPPDEIVVGIGPGSYTGLRVASATAALLKRSITFTQVTWDKRRSPAATRGITRSAFRYWRPCARWPGIRASICTG